MATKGMHWEASEREKALKGLAEVLP